VDAALQCEAGDMLDELLIKLSKSLRGHSVPRFILHARRCLPSYGSETHKKIVLWTFFKESISAASGAN
jgi:hypothetical protein